MRRRVVFLGPSLPQLAGATRIQGVEVLPPIAALDLLRLELTSGDVVGIVDGYFHQSQAVPHKEILAILGKGVHVFGAASLGALRAAELEPWGMRGVGRIFAGFRARHLVADDEVALRHAGAEHGYARLSEPLVNIRATLAAAVRAGICARSTAVQLIASFGSTPYPSRRWSMLAEHARNLRLTEEQTEAVVEYCRLYPIDMKRLDAEELMKQVARFAPSVRDMRSDPPRTVYLYRWQLAISAAAGYESLRLLQVLHPQFARWYQDLILSELRTDCQAKCGITSADPVRHGAHLGLYGVGADAASEFLNNWTTADERRDLNHGDLLQLFLARSLRLAPGVAPVELMLRVLEGSLVGDTAKGLLSEINQTNVRAAELRNDYNVERIARSEVSTWLTRLWAVAGAEPHDFNLAAMSRGFVSGAEAVRVARPMYLWAVCSADRVASLPPLMPTST